MFTLNLFAVYAAESAIFLGLLCLLSVPYVKAKEQRVLSVPVNPKACTSEATAVLAKDVVTPLLVALLITITMNKKIKSSWL